MRDLLVHVAGAIGTPTGYGVHATAFAEALGRECEVVTSFMDEQAEGRQRVTAALAAGRPAATVLIMPPSYFPPRVDTPGPVYGWCVWEGDRLPSSWRAHCCRVDRVWTATEWGRTVMRAGGVEANVVPEGVDTAVFAPEGTANPTIAALPHYKFLTLGKWEERKFTAQLMHAFDAEFADCDDVLLLASCINPFIDGFDPLAAVDALGLRAPHKVVCLKRVGGPADVAAIYRAAHAFVAPSRAEGWGLPIVEAMACGLPTITTAYSAMTAYAHTGNALLVGHRTVPMAAALDNEPRDEIGAWAEPDTGDLRRLMRWCYENRSQAQALGARAAVEMRERWTWRHAALRALELVRI